MEKNKLSLTSLQFFWAATLLSVIFFIFIAAPFAHANKQFKDGNLFSSTGKAIKMHDYLEMALACDYILIGENHDSPHHHQMQASFLEALAKAGKKPAVGFEMLYSRNQHLLESFNQRKIKVAKFEENSGWQQSWGGYPFSLYAPIFTVVENYDLPVYGLNISRATIDSIKKEGFEKLHDSNLKNEIPDLPKEIIWPKDEQVEYLHKIRKKTAQWQQSDEKKQNPPASQKNTASVKNNDAKPNDKDSSPNFLLVQSLWDTSMAESAILARKNSNAPMVIIAGSGHVENGWGIAHRIKTIEPEATVLLILPLAHPFTGDDDKRKLSADIFYASRPAVLSAGVILQALPDQVIVDEVKDGSRAKACGIKAGDRIVSFEGQEMKSPSDFHSAVAIADVREKRTDSKKKKKTILIERGQETIELKL